MTTPPLTIAIATINDYNGIWSTVSSLLLYHADEMKDCELLIVDQAPGEVDGQRTAKFYTKKIKARVANRHLHSANYIPDHGVRGVGPARNLLFRHATARHVLVLDSHVMLESGTLKTLMRWWSKNPKSNDLLTGPLLSDGGGFVGTHQELRWRGGALGTWAKDSRAFNAAGEPFEIPMQGLGLFSCRKAAFPGFSPHQRGFGCAEAAFCQAFRDKGSRVLCHPGLRWIHRFEGGALTGTGQERHRALTLDKVANYLIEFHRRGMDPMGIIDHFKGQLTPDDQVELRKRCLAYGER